MIECLSVPMRSFPSRPFHCRATPAGDFPFLPKPLSSKSKTDSGMHWFPEQSAYQSHPSQRHLLSTEAAWIDDPPHSLHSCEAYWRVQIGKVHANSRKKAVWHRVLKRRK